MQFSTQHRAEFEEMLTGQIEPYAINQSAEPIAFGPWNVLVDHRDDALAKGLKRRFRAATRHAAIAAGAPPRANLQDWWIAKLAKRCEGAVHSRAFTGVDSALSRI